VQQFFARLLEDETIDRADEQRGRFRSFLLLLLKRFLVDEHRRAHAQKRGGQARIVSLDFEDGERRYRLEPTDEPSPERIFERRWALTILDRVLERLASDYAQKGKQQLFDDLRGCLTSEFSTDAYSTIAQRLNMAEGAVKTAAHRLRARYRDALRAEIAQTVEQDEDIDDELNELLAALS
jgi:RNA polymerase sigma-70 factor (ECF subfamily)